MGLLPGGKSLRERTKRGEQHRQAQEMGQRCTTLAPGHRGRYLEYVADLQNETASNSHCHSQEFGRHHESAPSSVNPKQRLKTGSNLQCAHGNVSATREEKRGEKKGEVTSQEATEAAVGILLTIKEMSKQRGKDFATKKAIVLLSPLWVTSDPPELWSPVVVAATHSQPAQPASKQMIRP